MESSGVLSLLTQLDDEIDDLEETLSSLLKVSLTDSASKLPLLDKAKLYVLITYAIESVLFSYLRLNGINARAHPVFQELTRVKQYFDKIKNIEFPPERKVNLDKAAAARFVKAGLAGNSNFDLNLAEKRAKDRAKAHLRFDESTYVVAMNRTSDTNRRTADGNLSNPDSITSLDSSDGDDNSPQAEMNVRSNPSQISSASDSPSGQSAGEQGGDFTQSNKVADKKATRTKRKKRSGDDGRSHGERYSKIKKRA